MTIGPVEAVAFEPIDVLLIGSAGLDSLGVPCEVRGSAGPEEAIDLML